VNGSVDAREDPWRRLEAIRVHVALLDSDAAELEQLGLTLSSRALADVDHADLVSYVVWISQFAAHTNQVLANWGVGLVAYIDGSLRAAGMEPPVWTFPPPGGPAADVGVSAGRPRRWWRRS
jgi:hypothetical protein